MNQAIVDYITKNESHETQADMAKHLGICQRTVCRYMRELGIQSRGKPTPKRIEDIEFTFANFYKKYRSLAIYLAYKIMKDAYEAEEVVSVSFIYIFNKWDEFRSEEGLVAYLRKLIKHRASNRLRDLWTYHKKCTPFNPLAFQIYFSHIESQEYYNSISSELITMLLSELTPSQKRVVALKMEGFTEKEISETLNIRRSNISTYWIAAINRMKRKLLKMPQYKEIIFH